MRILLIPIITNHFIEPAEKPKLKFRLTTIASAMILSCNTLADNLENIERIAIQGQYLSSNEVNSIKTPTPVIDIPQSLSILSAAQITLRGIQSVGQIIDYMPGVNTSQGEGHRDAVVFRGVRSTADFYFDGNRDDVQYYRSLYNIEQVEILRGPNALLFGRGGTGGVLNRVSKKAKLDQGFVNYQASLNSFGGISGSIDTNFTTSKDSAFRVNAMYEQLENHRDFYYGERYGFNPTAHIQFNPTTQLDLSYEYADHKRFIDRGIPTSENGEPVEAFKDIVFGDPQNNYHTLEAHLFRANLSHEFLSNVKGNFSAFYGDFDKVYTNFYAAAYNPPESLSQDNSLDTVQLDGYIDKTVRDNATLSANIVADLQTGAINHTIIVGGEFAATNSDQNRVNPVFSSTGNDREWFSIQRPLDFRGLAGINAHGDAVTASFSSINDDTRVKLDVFSLYVQDEIEVSDKLDIVIGARFDSFGIEVFDANPNFGGSQAERTRTRTDEEISPRAGIIYKPQENISLYASYSESFLPRSGEQYANINGNNNQLDPNTYENQEIGIKWDFAEGLSFTAAVFENQQSSPQTADNDPATLDVIDSEISGFETQVVGHLTEDWWISANYSYLDGEIVDRNGATGRTPRELPENTFSIWSQYHMSDDFSFAIGATYQGESYINNSNTATLPSYMRIDAAAYYYVSDALRVQLHIENLTDELYFPNAHSTHQATVAAPLNAMLKLVGSL